MKAEFKAIASLLQGSNRSLLDFMATQECAIMQEHITARALALVAISFTR